MLLKAYLILRSARRARLEGRKAVLQPAISNSCPVSSHAPTVSPYRLRVQARGPQVLSAATSRVPSILDLAAGGSSKQYRKQSRKRCWRNSQRLLAKGG